MLVEVYILTAQLLSKIILVMVLSCARNSQAAPENLIYEYFNINVDAGQFGIDVINSHEDVLINHLNGRWSGMITENIYSSLNINYFSGEGDKNLWSINI